MKRAVVVDLSCRERERRSLPKDEGQRTKDREATRETGEILLTSPSGPSRCETVPRLYVHGYE